MDPWTNAAGRNFASQVDSKPVFCRSHDRRVSACTIDTRLVHTIRSKGRR